MNAEVKDIEKKIWRKRKAADSKKNRLNKVYEKRNDRGIASCWTDSRLDEMKRKEFGRLRHMVPAIATKPKVPKILVIEEAIRYIDELHEALADRVKSNGLPTCLSSVNIDAETSNSEDIRRAIKNWIANSQDFAEGAVYKRRHSDHLVDNNNQVTSPWSKADSPSSKTKTNGARSRFAPYKFTKPN